MIKKKLKLGTRSSPLALWQAHFVKMELSQFHPDVDVEIVPIKTQGDLVLDRPLSEIGGKGLFLKEIEQELLYGHIDFAVHSLKDVPADLPLGLVLSAFIEREDPRDVLISRNGLPFLDMITGSVVGTSSVRRISQLKSLRPDIQQRI